MKYWQYTLWPAAIILSLISIALPAAQWAAIPADSTGQVLAAYCRRPGYLQAGILAPGLAALG